jgi:sugar phosphate isomerase/epimerase
MPASDLRAREASRGHASSEAGVDPLTGRLGLSVPHEWWPSAPLLKSYEAAGFDWVQLHSPPVSVLCDARQCIRHAIAVTSSLATTGLEAVIHAPGGLRVGDSTGDRVLEGLLSYAAEIGAAQIVYHALALPETPARGADLAREARSLQALASLAERLEVTIAIENLAPLYPAAETVSANPLSLRGLVRRIGSPRLSICLDVGHAHVVADRRHTWADKICEPVLDQVSIFHLHDNLGARRERTGAELGVDPLRLDLHLSPGRGTLRWDRMAPLLAAHRAPLVLEVHPPHRPRAHELAAGTLSLLSRPGARDSTARS